MKTPRYQWKKEGGIEATVAILKVLDTPQHIIDKFCCMGLSEQYNKYEAIINMVSVRRAQWGNNCTFPERLRWEDLKHYYPQTSKP